MGKKSIGNIDDLFKEMHVNRTQQISIVEGEKVISKTTPDDREQEVKATSNKDGKNLVKECKVRSRTDDENYKLFLEYMSYNEFATLNQKHYKDASTFYLKHLLEKERKFREH